jgi:hypothetical protein
MNPKEKAQEILTMIENDVNPSSQKLVATMAVEQIIFNNQDKIIDDESKIAFTNFWQEVKSEIQKL